MELSRQERIELHDRLVVNLPGVRASLMSRFPEIASVDLGLKESNGKLTEQLAWRIFVTKKKEASELKPEEMIPREVAGVPTDVFTHEDDTLEEDTSNYSPLWGGIRITAAGAGTLGCFVHLTADATKKVHILSNHHVLTGAFGANPSGKLVGQAGAACDLCCCKCCEVAVVVDGKIGNPANPGATNIIDASYAILKGQTPGDTKTIHYSNQIVGIGPVFGSGVAAVGDVVRKRGSMTEFTVGTITSITANATITDTGTNYPNNQLSISPAGPSTDWSDGGDSGSAVVNNMNQVVGLHFAGSGVTGKANIISNVTGQLGLTVFSSGTAGTVPLSGIAEAPLVTANPAHFLTKIEQKLKETSCGQAFLNAIHENQREVLDLINDNREVKVAWNRFQGPAYVGHFAKNANEPAHRIPADVNGYSLQNLLIKMNDVLERNGSRKLARAVEDYSQTAFQFASEYTGIDSIDGMLNRGDFCPHCGTLKNGKHYA